MTHACVCVCGGVRACWQAAACEMCEAVSRRVCSITHASCMHAGLRGKLGRLQSGLVSISAAAPEAGAQEARRHLDKLLAGEA